MDLNTYQQNVYQLSEYHKELGPFSMILKMIGDIGVLGTKLHTVLEENKGAFTDEEKAKVSITLGDMLTDISNIAMDLNIPMSEVMALNLKKLELIKQRREKQVERIEI